MLLGLESTTTHTPQDDVSFLRVHTLSGWWDERDYMQVLQLQSTLPRSDVDTSAVLFCFLHWHFEMNQHTQTRESLGWNFSSCSLWVIKSRLCRCLEHQLLLSQSVDAIEDHVTSCCGFSARKMHDYQDDSLVVFAKSNIVITTSHT